MQTFLPGDTRGMEFVHAASILDGARLRKQRIEVQQIWLALTTGKGWVHHPATLAWKGFEQALLRYGYEIAIECARRGWKDGVADWCKERMEVKPFSTPPWLEDPLLHATHRSSLLRKDFDYYSRFGWSEPDDLEYVWPVVNATWPRGYYLRLSKPGLKRIQRNELQDPFMWADVNRPSALVEGVRL